VSDTLQHLRVGHSPDPDDAFMYFALAKGRVELPGCEIEHVIEDIESLNRRALRGELEVTAVSARAFARVAERYFVMTCGGSIGRGYGPVVVAEGGDLELSGARVGIPGGLTTASLLAELYLPRFSPVELPFDAMFDALSAGRIDAAVIIHEGQVTYRERGLSLVRDLGRCWEEDTGMPLPLGLDVVRKDVGQARARGFARALVASIGYAQEHFEEALAYALEFARGANRETVGRFVSMYVNADTIDMGEEGKRALATLYRKAVERGLLAAEPEIEFVAP